MGKWLSLHAVGKMFLIFLCPHVTVEDMERNDGSAERPYFMSQNLLSLLKKSNEESKSVD